jgi:hypothetical protein
MDRICSENGPWKGSEEDISKNRREEWEDLNVDGRKMLKRVYGSWRLKHGDRRQWTVKKGRLL